VGHAAHAFVGLRGCVVDAALTSPGRWVQQVAAVVTEAAARPRVYPVCLGFELAWMRPLGEHVVVRVYPTIDVVQWFVWGLGRSGDGATLGQAGELLRGAVESVEKPPSGGPPATRGRQREPVALVWSDSVSVLVDRWVIGMDPNVLAASTRSQYTSMIRSFGRWLMRAGVHASKDLEAGHVEQWIRSGQRAVAESTRFTKTTVARFFLEDVARARAAIG